MAGTFVSRILLWRFLGPSDFGVLAVAVNVISTAAKVSALGLPAAFQYFGSKPGAGGGNLRPRALGVGLVAGLIGTVIVVAGHFALASHSAALSLKAPMYLILAGGVLVISLTSVLQGLLLGWNRVRAFSAVVAVNGTALPVFFVALLPFVAPLQAAILSQFAVWTVALVVAIITTSRPPSANVIGSRSWRDILSYSLASWPLAILSVGSARIGVILGAQFTDSRAIGQFALALGIAESAFALHSPLTQLMFSRISAQTTESFSTVAKSIRLSVLGALVILSLYVLAGQPIVLLAFGDNARSVWAMSIILLATGCCHSITRLLNALCSGMGRPTINTAAMATEVSVLVILIVLLAPRYGSSGLVVASTSAAAAGCIFGVVAGSRIMNFPIRDMIVPTRRDVASAVDISRDLLRWVFGRFANRRPSE